MPCVHAKGNGTSVGDSVQEVTKLFLVRLDICLLQWAASGIDRNFCLVGKKGFWEEKMLFLSC